MQEAVPGFISAMTTGASLAGANMLVQVLLIPLYVKMLSEADFGFLMILLSCCGFAAIGIGWLSGGLVRLMGERWAQSDNQGFREVFAVGKISFTSYAILLSIVGVLLWCFFQQGPLAENQNTWAVLLTGVYLIFHYELLTERLAFIGTNKQSQGNQIEFVRLLAFIVLTWLYLPKYAEVSTVIAAMIVSLFFQRTLMAFYWRRKVGLFGWMNYSSQMGPILKRLVGKQGIGYLSCGSLIILLQSDILLIGLIGGDVAAGQFVLLWKIPQAIGLLLALIPATLTPRVIHLDAAGDQHNWRFIFVKGRRYFFIITLLASALYLFVGEWLAVLWVGNKAIDTWWMYAAGSGALFLTAFSKWPISFAIAVIKLKPLARVALVELLCKITLTILLYPTLGIASPLVAIIIVHTLYVAWAYQGLFKQKAGKPLPQ